jgi:phosphatidylglycerophosphate synthase
MRVILPAWCRRGLRAGERLAQVGGMPDIAGHSRANDMLLGAWERPLLAWLVTRMPARVTPDGCTAVGVGGAVVTAAGYGLSNVSAWFLWLASFGLLLHWFGDSLDGTLARHRGIERPRYGFYVDHVSDAVCQILIFAGLGWTPYVSVEAACFALIGYQTLVILIHIRTCVVGEFRIAYAGLGPTEARLLAILLNTAMFLGGVRVWTVLGVRVSFYDVAVVGAGVLTFVFFGSTGYRELVRLRRSGT